MEVCGLAVSELAEIVTASWLPSPLRGECLKLWCNVMLVGDASSRIPMETGTRVWRATRVVVEKEEQREAMVARTMDQNMVAREMLEGWR